MGGGAGGRAHLRTGAGGGENHLSTARRRHSRLGSPQGCAGYCGGAPLPHQRLVHVWGFGLGFCWGFFVWLVLGLVWFWVSFGFLCAPVLLQLRPVAIRAEVVPPLKPHTPDLSKG